MELADDAEGRVAIFPVDGDAEAETEAPRQRQGRGRGPMRAAGTRVGAALDSRFVLPALGAVLVVVLLLGMLLKR